MTVPGGLGGGVAAAGSSAGAHGLEAAAVWPQEDSAAAANLSAEGPSGNVTLRRKRAKGSRSVGVLEHALVHPAGEREALPAADPASTSAGQCALLHAPCIDGKTSARPSTHKLFVLCSR